MISCTNTYIFSQINHSLLKSYIKLRLSTSREVQALRYTGEIRLQAIGVMSSNASEGMVLVTVGVIMPMIALSEVGRDKVAARRTCLNAGRQKVNRPNVAPMGVTSPPIYWWVVDSKAP